MNLFDVDSLSLNELIELQALINHRINTHFIMLFEENKHLKLKKEIIFESLQNLNITDEKNLSIFEKLFNIKKVKK